MRRCWVLLLLILLINILILLLLLFLLAAWRSSVLTSASCSLAAFLPLRPSRSRHDESGESVGVFTIILGEIPHPTQR